MKDSQFSVNSAFEIRFNEHEGGHHFYLSCDASGNIVDLWQTNDGSGRQRWVLQKVENSSRYRICVGGGVERSRWFLSYSSSVAKLHLSDGTSTEDHCEWDIVPADDAEKKPNSYHIRLTVNGAELAADARGKTVKLATGGSLHLWEIKELFYVRSIASAAAIKYLSCDKDGKTVDLFHRSDNSGRQFWIFHKQPGCEYYTIQVSGGVDRNTIWLSMAGDASKVDLYERNDSTHQQWYLEFDNTDECRIYCTPSTAGERWYLSVDPHHPKQIFLKHLDQQNPDYQVWQIGNRHRWCPAAIYAWQKQHDGYRAGFNYIPSSACNQIEMFHEGTFDAQIKRIEKELEWAKTVGFNSVRVFLHDKLWNYDETPEATCKNTAFLGRISHFLDVASNYGFKVLIVFFDSCWHDHANEYKVNDSLYEPMEGMHNGRWLQSPGASVVNNYQKWIAGDTTKFDEFSKLKIYVQGVVDHFKTESRILGWDLWNEPDFDTHDADFLLGCIEQVYEWVKEINPAQPITICVHKQLTDETDGKFKTRHKHGMKVDYEHNKSEPAVIHLSDVISFHLYENNNDLKKHVKYLNQNYNPDHRPIICTEYLARKYPFSVHGKVNNQNDSTSSHFDHSLKLFKDENIWAFHWGLIAGKTMTIYCVQYSDGVKHDDIIPWGDRPVPSKVPEDTVISSDHPFYHDIAYLKMKTDMTQHGRNYPKPNCLDSLKALETAIPDEFDIIPYDEKEIKYIKDILMGNK